MALYHIAVTSENLSHLWSKCRWVRDSAENWGFAFHPYSETWLLYLDFRIARRRYGRNDKEVAAYLRAGREDWGL